ncbi:MAG TPA: nuclear transport factor 2 family protein, partial [Thermoanaerobaculia bacterium]|nr:nuclear transport factor 2 family protein [Thermoanaerobaculia bacterium]
HSSIESIKHEDEPTVKTHGTTSLVLSRVTIVGKYSGREVSTQFRSLHVWINEGGHWRLAFNQLTPIDEK